ncbi:MAG: hypothetical protein M1812_004429 [Candelaria pacifica]|nr:MAG: hypothetical protein M1812_004429 [Candelaria pacifica]
MSVTVSCLKVEPPRIQEESPVAPANGHDGSVRSSPIDEVDGFGNVNNKRKYASTGGGRAWTEQEEVYLLQTRLQKMPYKHIAAQLKKTELACRLHYHQVAHGSNRRKRNVSISSASSGQSSSTGTRTSPDPEDHITPVSPQQRLPSSFTPISPAITKPAVDVPGSASPFRYPKPLLPRPNIPVVRRSSEPLRGLKGLRLDTSGVPNKYRPQVIDKERLRRAYEAHRATFWKVIACDYGDNVSPVLLEQAWKKDGIAGPLTPCDSPEDITPSGTSTTSLRPSAFPAFCSSAVESRGGFSPINYVPPPTSAIEKGAYFLPTPSSANTERRRSSVWSATVLNDDNEARSRSTGPVPTLRSEHRVEDTIMEEAGH